MIDLKKDPITVYKRLGGNEEREILTKKDDGSTLGELIPIILCIVVVSVILLMFMRFMQDFSTKDNLDSIARKYVLKMEADGYLTPENEASLLEELADAGMVGSTIDLVGTTRTRVSYGESIQLVIVGKMRIVSLDVNNILSPHQQDDTMDIVIQKLTTAKN